MFTKTHFKTASTTETTSDNQSSSESIRLRAVSNTPSYEYLSVHDETATFPPVELFNFHNRGLGADKASPNLLNHPGISLTRLTPRSVLKS